MEKPALRQVVHIICLYHPAC